MDTKKLKQIACDAIDAASDDLNTLSQELWKRPELSFQETFAHSYLTDFFEKRSFDVKTNFVTDTGFRCTTGDNINGANVAILCEYDALPDVGHACGHNLISEIGAGASLGVKAALDASKYSGKSLGKVCHPSWSRV